jgi:hypothetical protein
MTFQDIQTMLEQKPFEPFKIVVDNDREYEIRHPEMVVLAERVLIIMKPINPEKGVPESFQAIVGFSHISTIPPLAA